MANTLRFQCLHCFTRVKWESDLSQEHALFLLGTLELEQPCERGKWDNETMTYKVETGTHDFKAMG